MKNKYNPTLNWVGFFLFLFRPVFLKNGQMSIGLTRGYFRGLDGVLRVFGKDVQNAGVIDVPTPDVDFNFTGTYEVINDSPDENPLWRIKFLSSGIFTPKSDMVVDVFAVGAGGSAIKSPYGGGGGYTTTSKNITLQKDNSYSLTIGAPNTSETSRSKSKPRGGSSIFAGVTALGGYDASYYSSNMVYTRGGDGGSGGGGQSGNGGSDGSDGEGNKSQGTGQGTTTREFGEDSGDLYAGGGGYITYSGGSGGGGNGADVSGDNARGKSGNANTGGGAGGGNVYANNALGGTGIIVIRNHRE